MKKRMLAAVTAAVFVLLSVCSAMPALARVEEPAVKYATPGGYADNDYQKLIAFLETEDDSGVKNGNKAFQNYDPTNPDAWSGNAIIWSSSGTKYLETVRYISNKELVGDLDLSGCIKLKTVDCRYNSIISVNVSGCTLLQQIICSNNSAASLNCSGCSSLTEIYCGWNPLAQLDISGCSALEKLSAISCRGLTALDFSGLSALKEVDLSNGGTLQSLNTSGCSSLELLNCRQNCLTELNISGCSALRELECDYNQLSEIDLSSCPGLTFLNANENTGIEELDVTGCHDLVKLYFNHTHVGEIDLSNCTALERLSCSNIWNLYELDISACSSLISLDCSYDSNLEQLDLSNCPELSTLDTRNTKISSYDLSNNPNLYFNSVTTYGGGAPSATGWVSYYTNWGSDTVKATATNRSRFIGWYSPDGELITESATVYKGISSYTDIVAYFEVKYDYNEDDVAALRAFFETEDAEGVKIGMRVNPDYHPDDPYTWTVESFYDVGAGVEWSGNRASGLYLDSLGIVGELTAPACSAITTLSCIDNSLTSIDVSALPALRYFYCSGNELTELDLSANPNLYFRTIRAEGGGHIAFGTFYDEYIGWYQCAAVDPEDAEDFIGWYAPNGALISRDPYLDETDTQQRDVVARFGEVTAVPGDADGDGVVDTTDALLVLRAALGISGDVNALLENCDMDGNGVIDTTDALLLLRLALNIG